MNIVLKMMSLIKKSSHINNLSHPPKLISINYNRNNNLSILINISNQIILMLKSISHRILPNKLIFIYNETLSIYHLNLNIYYLLSI